MPFHQTIRIEKLEKYVQIGLEQKRKKHQIMLWRGQSDRTPLLPGIFRQKDLSKILDQEKQALDDFKRRSKMIVDVKAESEWDWLVYAQHYELKTRLLDWSTNALTAMFFAIENRFHFHETSYVYLLAKSNEHLVDIKQDNPFQIRKTMVLRPILNNDRIVAQSGWFTAHAYETGTNGGILSLEQTPKYSNEIWEFEIPASAKEEMLSGLSMLGVNYRTTYPDLEGLSRHLNQKYFK